MLLKKAFLTLHFKFCSSLGQDRKKHLKIEANARSNPIGYNAGEMALTFDDLTLVGLPYAQSLS